MGSAEVDVDAPSEDGGTGAWARVRRGMRPTSLLVLVAAAFLPFLGFMNANQDSSYDALAVLAYAAAVAVVLVAVDVVILAAMPRADGVRVVFGTAAFATMFFAHKSWESLFEVVGVRLGGPGWVRLLVWALVAVVVVRVVASLARRPLFRQWALATLLLVCGINAAGLVIGAFGDGGGEQIAGSDDDPPATPDDLVRSPNVYLFLLDAYSRNDVLLEQTGMDNRPFHDALDERGFVTTDRALTSYPSTILSTMALFEGDYLATEPDDFEGGSKAFEHFIQGDNSTAERFRQLGYRTVHSHAGPFLFARCNPEFADVCIEADGGGAGELEVVLLDLTPVPLVAPLDAPRTTPAYVVDQLERVAPEEPFFLFAHVLAPHHPYMYDERCELWDDAVSKPSVTLEEERDLYANEVRCVNAAVLESVDRILERDPDAVVVIASDHGSELLTDWDADLADWTEEQLQERFGVQNNLRLPEECRDTVDDDTPLVADFEIVFACLEGREPEIPDYRGFLWRFHTTYIEEIPPERWEPLTAPPDAPTG